MDSSPDGARPPHQTEEGAPGPAGPTWSTGRDGQVAAVDAVGDELAERLTALDPTEAALAGVAVAPEWGDWGPDGSQAWAAAHSRALRILDDLVLDDPTARLRREVLRERCLSAVQWVSAGLRDRPAAVTSRPGLARLRLDAAEATGAATGDRSAYDELVAALPAALDAHADALLAGLDGPLPATRPQVLTILQECREEALGGEGPVEAAYAHLADRLEREVLPRAATEESVGPDLHAVALREVLGEDVDVEAAWESVCEDLRVTDLEVRALAREVAGGEVGSDVDAADAADAVAAACARLAEDPRHRLAGADRLAGWLDGQVDRLAGLAAELVTVPGWLALPRARVYPGGGAVGYVPPAADGSTPATLDWAPTDVDVPQHLWPVVTAVAHEAAPGHHVQVGAAVTDAALAAWQRSLFVHGHAEGWATYAEGLLAAAGGFSDPAHRLGHLLVRRERLAAAVADLGVHSGRPLPVDLRPGGPAGDCGDGGPGGPVGHGGPVDSGDSGDSDGDWGPAAHARFLTAYAAPGTDVEATVLRQRGWPGQAAAHALGSQRWTAVREHWTGEGHLAHVVHDAALVAGPCGLALLDDAVRLVLEADDDGG